MIFLYFGLFLGFIWYMANKHLGSNFNNYLKYASLFFIAIFIATDVFLFIETERFYLAKSIGGDSGITYSYWNNATNTTVETTMFNRQDEDAGTVMAYHWTEYGVMPFFVMMLPYVAIFVTFTFALQILYIWWSTAYYGTETKNKKDDKGSF